MLFSRAPFFIYRRNSLTSGFQKLSFLNFFPKGLACLYRDGDLLACICTAFVEMRTSGSSSFSRLLALWLSRNSSSLSGSIFRLKGLLVLLWQSSYYAPLAPCRYFEKSGRKKSITFSSVKSKVLASTFSTSSS